MQSISPEKIAAVMALVPVPKTFAELDERVRFGLPKAALQISVKHVARTPSDGRTLLYSIIPEATFKRRSKLNTDESGKAERLARVFATASYVWDSEEEAKEFINTPHAMLNGRTPLDVAMTELGARRVETLLWELCYGLPV
jgi:putative toxin-antitoxin system antitoxin component (TIGR02293 family)